AGTPAFRVFTVDGPAGAIRDVSVSLSGLTIANGQAAALAAGGGIFNTATLALTSCTLSGNSAFLGGGIENEGALTLADCTLAANTASLDGGGIDNTGTLRVTNCTLSSNSAFGGGGRFQPRGAVGVAH